MFGFFAVVLTISWLIVDLGGVRPEARILGHGLGACCRLRRHDPDAQGRHQHRPGTAARDTAGGLTLGRTSMNENDPRI